MGAEEIIELPEEETFKGKENLPRNGTCISIDTFQGFLTREIRRNTSCIFRIFLLARDCLHPLQNFLSKGQCPDKMKFSRINVQIKVFDHRVGLAAAKLGLYYRRRRRRRLLSCKRVSKDALIYRLTVVVSAGRV